MASDVTATTTPTSPSPATTEPAATTTQTQEPTTTPEPAETPSGKPGSLVTSTTETKPAEEPKTEEPKKEEAPPAFDLSGLKLPEGVDPKNDPQLQEFAELAKETGLTLPAGQKLLDMYQKNVTEFASRSQKAWDEVNQKWEAEIRADPEIGGEKLSKEVLPAITRLIDDVAGDKLGPEVRKALDLTGAGNNPAMVRFLAKLATFHSEAKQHVQGNATSGKIAAPGASAMYPNLPQG